MQVENLSPLPNFVKHLPGIGMWTLTAACRPPSPNFLWDDVLDDSSFCHPIFKNLESASCSCCPATQLFFLCMSIDGCIIPHLCLAWTGVPGAAHTSLAIIRRSRNVGLSPRAKCTVRVKATQRSILRWRGRRIFSGWSGLLFRTRNDASDGGFGPRGSNF